MRKLKLLILTILQIPVRIFSKISPFTLIRDSKLRRNCAILSNTRFYSSSIDEYSYIGRNCFISNTRIGKFCSIADNCNIGLASHPLTWVSTSPVFHKGNNILNTNFAYNEFNDFKTTEIGNDVWIGINVCIKAGVKIGTGAIIGAGTIITKDIEPYAIVVGCPGKTIKYRFDDEKRGALLKSEWWNMDKKDLIIAANYINDVNKFIKISRG
ncbi:MAG TPA: hypothetical protein DIV40_08800 [Clostridiales bacterium]|jgi:acetyltransferase-like isoleucine patch superfamily enzyme|nr:CatB-related O-acetyltransferase [Tissierellia bacterium]HCS11540.1 hypothetical protein [Clostridiales bacterium]